MSNMKGLFKVFMVLFLLGLCSSSNQSYCQTQFVFDPAWMDISSETGGAEIGLEFTGDGAYWTVTTEADWLTIDPAEGEGASSITIEYSANEGLGRRAEILFQAPDSDIPAFTYLLRQQHSIPAEDLSFKWSVLEIDNAHQELVPYTGSMTVWFKAWEPAVYLNIVARNGEGQDPEWIIRNLYIPEASWFSRQQNLAVSFDLGLLGYDMGQPIEYLQFGYALSLYPDTLIMDIPDPDWREGIFELEKQGVMGYPPGWVYNGYPLTEFFPKEAFGDTITNKHYIGCEMKNGDIDYATYPWQVEGCGPAAAANSLMWLRDKHKEINFPGDFNQIMLYLSALMGKRGNGVSSEGFIRGKLDFIEMYKLPIKVKFQTKKINKNLPSSTGRSEAEDKDKSDDSHPDKDWIYNELKENEDVEMGMVYPGTGKGHIVAVSGTYTRNGKTYLYYKDDTKQSGADTTKLKQHNSSLIWADSMWLLPEQGHAAIDMVVSESFDPDHTEPSPNGFFSKYCQSFRRVLAPGKSLTLRYPAVEGRNFNTTVRILDRVSGSSFYTMGMWVNNSGTKKKITNRLSYPVTVEFHNDDRGGASLPMKTNNDWTIEIDELYDDPDDTTDPSNEFESAGFSVGSDDDQSLEFGQLVGPEVIYNDSINAYQEGIPQSMSPTGVRKFTLQKDVPVWSRYWLNLELVLGVVSVQNTGSLFISSLATGLSDTINISGPGEYIIPIGGMKGSGVFDIKLELDGKLSFHIDNIGIPTIVPIKADMHVNPILFDLPANETIDTSFMISNPGGLSLSWQLNYSADWFAVSPRNGNDETEIRLFVVPNLGIPRKDSVRIVAPDAENNIQYVVVSQDGDRSGIDLGEQTLDKLVLYPNPVSDMLSLEISFVKETEVDIAIYNYLGEEIYQKHYPISSSELTGEIDLRSFAEGSYFVVITAGKETHLRKIVKIQ
ncbi:MAG: T9SS type A sorting domain-containing protein [Bacteroidetes bacterium]|jgi:hypothetical protein|nr:T9SS type A sorting domain-containing protein [Bacteroidota bacterium]MBT4398252.1 T9SS type A sorting domain-containing protein [Bacteroidota bacterium]MBT4409037.1 T9SS type A sorting domain-containing protein [Bacteroidota bacterium]MBT7092717.1 T9SS type A sorting domain-containing protein [Bacteroidota bacterium]MBT7463816.1 T9SS type A sorting domain-containing protein [Bacteroidota bacterium]